MQSSRRLIACSLLVAGILFTLFGVAGLIYSSYPLGTQKAANKVGGPGVLLQLEVPRNIRISDAGIVRVNYEFSVAPEFGDSGQVVVPVVYENITVTLQTTSFDTAPPSGQPIAKRVKNDLPYEWIWVIKPKQVGQHLIVLQFVGIPGPLLAEIAFNLEVDQLPANSAIMSTLNWPDEEIFKRSKDPEFVLNLAIPISVVDVLGLTAIQARIASIIVTVLGPALTIPWLYEQWQKRRFAKDKKRQPGRRLVGDGGG
jgi:hypothetical protein